MQHRRAPRGSGVNAFLDWPKNCPPLLRDQLGRGGAGGGGHPHPPFKWISWGGGGVRVASIMQLYVLCDYRVS